MEVSFSHFHLCLLKFILGGKQWVIQPGILHSHWISTFYRKEALTFNLSHMIFITWSIFFFFFFPNTLLVMVLIHKFYKHKHYEFSSKSYWLHGLLMQINIFKLQLMKWDGLHQIRFGLKNKIIQIHRSLKNLSPGCRIIS